MPTILTRRASSSPLILTRRIKPGANAMDIIITGLWDDGPNWQDDKIWWDNGSAGTVFTRRPSI